MTLGRQLRRGLKSNARRVLQLLARGPSRRVRVLTYHSVDDSGSLISVTRDELRSHLSVLRDMGFRGLTAAQFVERKTSQGNAAKKNGPEVLLTFDDGYENFVLEAMPLLREFEFPATVFVVPTLMGQIAGWYKRDTAQIAKLMARVTHSAAAAERHLDEMRPLSSARLMTWEQAAEIVAAGFDVASHSNEHRFLTSLSDEQLVSDLSESRQSIQNALRVPAELICYPYGDCDSRVASIAAKVGYKIGFRVDPHSDRDNMQLGRWSVGPRLTSAEFRYLVSRASDIEETLRRRV
jgi:peptidoglycan/xylan/chitin deacetylase (PgdA/CDA1 family)